MSARISSGNLQFEMSTKPGGARAPRDPESPFCLAVVGDFSGRKSRGRREGLAGRRIWRIDLDNRDQVMASQAAALKLSLGPSPGEVVDLPFTALEDFHADELLKRVPPLADLVDQLKRMGKPGGAGGAAMAPKNSVAESNEDTMARLLGGASPVPTPAAAPKGVPGLNELIRSAVGSSGVPAPTAEQAAMSSVLDLELARQLNNLLHHPDFQALEATWRGLDLLVRNFGAEENLKLFLLDISKEELATDLSAQESLAASGLFQTIRRQAEEYPWAAWLVLHTFDATVADVDLLGRLAQVAASVGAQVLAGASPRWVGADSFAAHPDPDDWKLPLEPGMQEAWQALRKLPAAQYAGLALPRFLLRQPYGKGSEVLETWPFEELPPGAPHEHYLWGNPAIICGYLLASAFQADGWDFAAGGYGELGDLPVHKFTENGETRVMPDAEAWLNDCAAEAILSRGLMPVQSIRGRDAVRMMRLQSLAGRALPLGSGE